MKGHNPLPLHDWEGHCWGKGLVAEDMALDLSVGQAIEPVSCLFAT